MSDTHDLTPYIPLWRSEAGREILGGDRLVQSRIRKSCWFYAEPDGRLTPLDEVSSLIRDALAWRTLRWLFDVSSQSGTVYTENWVSVWSGDGFSDPDAIFAEAMRVVGVGDDDKTT
jgi:hypothetical protein